MLPLEGFAAALRGEMDFKPVVTRFGKHAIINVNIPRQQMVRTRGVMAATVIRFDHSAGVGGVGVGSLRRIGLDWAVCGRPSTADLVTNIGSGMDFCCIAVLVQPRNAPPKRRVIQPRCRSFRAMSRFSLNLFVEVPDESNSTLSPVFRWEFARFLKGTRQG